MYFWSPIKNPRQSCNIAIKKVYFFKNSFIAFLWGMIFQTVTSLLIMRKHPDMDQLKTFFLNICNWNEFVSVKLILRHKKSLKGFYWDLWAIIIGIYDIRDFNIIIKPLKWNSEVLFSRANSYIVTKIFTVVGIFLQYFTRPKKV